MHLRVRSSFRQGESQASFVCDQFYSSTTHRTRQPCFSPETLPFLCPKDQTLLVLDCRSRIESNPHFVFPNPYQLLFISLGGQAKRNAPLADIGPQSTALGFLELDRERGPAYNEPQFSENRGKRLKRTYQPKKSKRRATCGFLARMSTPAGRKLINRRRAKGRKRLALS